MKTILRSKLKVILAVSMCMIVCYGIWLAPAVYSGAWAQQKGHYYTKITSIYSGANAIYGMNSDATFDNYSLYLYGEYGILNRLTGIASMPAFKRSISEANFVHGRTDGFLAGDLEVQLKYQFIDRPIVTSVAVGSKIPIGYDIYDLPPLGNDQTDFDVKLLLGGSFYPTPMYITADAGYRKRGGSFIDEYNFTFEVGYTFFKKFLLRGMSTGIRSTKSGQGESNLIGFPYEEDQLRLGGGLIYILNSNVEMDVTYLKTTSGTNIPKFDEIFIGIAYKK